MRLGTDVVAVCWAEQMKTNNKVERAIATIVLKRRIEAPCGRSPGFNIFGVNDFEPWLTKRSVATWRRGEPRTARAALTSVGPRGKGFFTPAAPRNNQRVPCRSSLPELLQLNT